MKIIKPYYIIETPIDYQDILFRIEKAGRTCYKSEDKITQDSAEKFVSILVKNGHESVLEHVNITIRFICDRGVTHELVRHRLASYSQESTRYCNYSGEIVFIKPCFLKEDTKAYEIWETQMGAIEDTYRYMINQLKMTPQEARCILPNSLKTEIVMTANIREWRHVLKERTSVRAHPQIREIMIPLLEEFKLLMPILFKDIKY